MRIAEVHDEVDKPRSVGEIRSQLEVSVEVSTPLTPTPDHLLCLYLRRGAEEVRPFLNGPSRKPFGARVCSTRGDMTATPSSDGFCVVSVIV